MSLVKSFCISLGLSVLLAGSACAEQIEDLVRESIQVHPSIRSAQAQLRAAESNVAGAKWQFAPTLSVSAERINHSQTSDPSFSADPTVKYLRVQQPLWTGGRLTAGLQKSEYGLEVSRANWEDARLQVTLRVIQAYGDWVVAKLKDQSNQKSLVTHRRLHKLVLNRIEQGVAATSDEVLALGRIEAIKAEIEVSQSQQDIARSKLEQLVGRPVRIETYSLKAPNLDLNDVESMYEQALVRHPGYIKAAAQIEIQRASVAERRAALSPEVYVRTERQIGNYTYANVPPYTRMFIGLTTNFGSGLSRLSDLDNATASLAAATEDLETQKRSLRESLASDVSLVKAAEKRLTWLRIALKNAEDVLASYERQFLAGRKSWLDVMNSVRELSQAEIALADASSSLFVIRWRLLANVSGVDAVSEGLIP